jgi:hypothetical protein
MLRVCDLVVVGLAADAMGNSEDRWARTMRAKWALVTRWAADGREESDTPVHAHFGLAVAEEGDRWPEGCRVVTTSQTFWLSDGRDLVRRVRRVFDRETGKPVQKTKVCYLN